MTVNTQQNISLVVSLDGVDYACQVIDAKWTSPSVGKGAVTQTACPDGIAVEPGSVESGSLTGNVFADTSVSGITWALIEAQATDAQMAYIYTIWPELGPTHAVTWTGNCRVATLSLDHAKPGLGKHALDLEILTSDHARPAAAAA